MTVAEYLLLAFASMFWPILIVVVLLALRTGRPVGLLTAFLAGGLLTTIVEGTAIVIWLGDKSSPLNTHKKTVDPVLYIVIGVLAMATAYVLGRRPPRENRERKEGGMTERAMQDQRLAFVAGIVLNIVPGFFPIIALTNIAQLSATNTEKAILIVVFYVIMFAFVEVPIVGSLVAPEWTEREVVRFNDWLDSNGRRAALWVLALVGAYLVVRGLVKL